MANLAGLSRPALAIASNAALFSGGTLTVNGLGDSIIGGQSIFSYYNSPSYQAQLAQVPSYATGKAVAVGNLVKTGSGPYVIYRCVTAISATTTQPNGTGSSIADGSGSWAYVQSLYFSKSGTSMLTWAEIYSHHNLIVDVDVGYGGIVYSLLKVIVINGGTGYSASDIVTFNNGATGALSVSSGVITGVTITNPGYSGGSVAYAASITTSTGSGAVLSVVQGGSGTWGVSGCQSADMVARLPDILASSVNIVVVHGGTNDVVAGTSPATTIANLKTCYDTLLAAGKRVIAIPILPRATNMTGVIPVTMQRINQFIRDYCRGRPAANTNGYRQIALADPTGYWTDGANGLSWPVGGTGGVANAVTQDGLHPSTRGAQYLGYCIAKAAERWTGSPATHPSRAYSADAGYDPTLNPGGNMLEGPPWTASAGYLFGRQVSANGNVYRCLTAGTSAASGGPSGTGASITDGTCVWAFMFPAKMSVFASGTAGTLTAATGVTLSGALASGYTLARSTGTAAGAVTAAIENPWSSGQTGQRQSLVFSLGSGGATERWDLSTAFYGSTGMNIAAAELGVTKVYAEVEVEISNVANVTRLNLSCPVSAEVICYAGPALNQAGAEMISSSDVLAIPNGGKILLRTPVAVLPPALTNFSSTLSVGLNASGAAGSATLNLKINKFGIFRADQY